MTVEKQPDSEAETIDQGASDWFRQFLKHFELSLFESGQELPPDADPVEYRLATARAFKQTLLESGLDDAKIREIFGHVAYLDREDQDKVKWTAKLNARRFELIDRDIQGDLSRDETLELAGLTHLMREQVDNEANLPFEGARRIHRQLKDFDPDSMETDSDL